MANEELSLSHLARITGTERRTIRSYIAEGLLRGPDTVGRNASYSRHHLDRLRAIRVLRDQDGLGLTEIRRQFLTLSDEGITSIANRLQGAGAAEPSEGPQPDVASALDYIRDLRANLKAEQDIAPTEGTADDQITAAMTRRKSSVPLGTALPMMHLAQRASSDVEPASRMRAPKASSLQTSHASGATLRSTETLSEMQSRLVSIASDLRGRQERQDELVYQTKELHRAFRNLHDQTADFRERERDLRERLASTQSELEALRRAYQAAAMPALGPIDLTADPSTPRTETFVRIAILPDVEILVRGVPDGEKLKLIREHAENLRKGLLQDGNHDR